MRIRFAREGGVVPLKKDLRRWSVHSKIVIRCFCFISLVNLHEDCTCSGGNVRKLRRNNFQREKSASKNQTDRTYRCQQIHVLAPSFCGKVRKHFVLIYELFLSSMIGWSCQADILIWNSMYNKLFRCAMVIPHNIFWGRMEMLSVFDGYRWDPHNFFLWI